MPSFSDVFTELRKQNKMTQADLAEALTRIGEDKITRSAIGMWESGQRKPKYEILETIADFFNVDMDYLLGRSSVRRVTSFSPSNTAPAPVLSHEESHLVKLYRRADEIDKRTVMTVLSRYEAEEDPAPPIRYIRHYLVPAAAGYASPIEGEEYENVPLPPDAPQEADFCIEIQGDSMEPFIQDGKRVYVKQGAPLQEFDPGIFFVDGDVFCKQWCPGYAGETYLLSANPKREDANITIFRDSGRSCVYFGKVLLDKKLPRPNYK